MVQQLADDRRVGQRRGADQRGVGVLGGDGLADGGIGCVRQTQPEVLTAMNQIKNALDPKHILNDQKSYVKGEKNHATTV